MILRCDGFFLLDGLDMVGRAGVAPLARPYPGKTGPGERRARKYQWSSCSENEKGPPGVTRAALLQIMNAIDYAGDASGLSFSTMYVARTLKSTLLGSAFISAMSV